MLSDIVDLAREAGESVATAHKKLGGVICEVSAHGIRAYDHPTVKQAREAFAASMAASGRTKNNGYTLFARAWDEAVSDLGLDARPSKGKSRHAKAKAEPTPAIVENAPDVPQIDIAAVRRAAVSDFISASGIGLDTLKLCVQGFVTLQHATQCQQVTDATFAIEKVAESIVKILELSGQSIPDGFAADIAADIANTHAKPATEVADDASAESQDMAALTITESADDAIPYSGDADQPASKPVAAKSTRNKKSKRR